MEIHKFYDFYNEDERLNKSKAGSVEFITTTAFIEKYLFPEDRILDIGAGAGAYSIYYAGKGYDVTSVEPVERNLDFLKSKITDNMKINALCANALDLSAFEENSFDIVLCMGPLYHLKDNEDKIKAIEEAKRVCKQGGKIFYAYISNDMVFVTETFLYKPNPLRGEDYNRENFKIHDEPLAFLTVAKAGELLNRRGIKKITQYAAEGLSELMAEKINTFDDEQFNEWLKFHFYACEKEELLGFSNHVVYVAEKE